jgi:hypothetical protein
MHALIDDIARWAKMKISKADPASLPPVEADDENN